MKTMVLTVEELEAIRDEAAEKARREGGDNFSPEEMKAIREQYEQRIEEESTKREDLEWRLRLAIARLRDVESATDKLRAIQDSLKGVLGEVGDEDPENDEEQTQPRIIPGRRVTPPAVPARALRGSKRAIA
jgi:chromosome segregation ATPase